MAPRCQSVELREHGAAPQAGAASGDEGGERGGGLLGGRGPCRPKENDAEEELRFLCEEEETLRRAGRQALQVCFGFGLDAGSPALVPQLSAEVDVKLRG